MKKITVAPTRHHLEKLVRKRLFLHVKQVLGQLSDSLYEASYGDISSMFFMMLAGYTGDTKGFVLYRDNDNKDEVLSYTSTSGITVCTVTDVPRLGTVEFRNCLDESPGEQIHEKIANLEF